MVNRFSEIETLEERVRRAESLLEKLERQTLIPGAGIRITETDYGILVETEPTGNDGAEEARITTLEERLSEFEESAQTQGGANDAREACFGGTFRTRPTGGPRAAYREIREPFQINVRAPSGNLSNFVLVGYLPASGCYMRNQVFAGGQKIAEVSFIEVSYGGPQEEIYFLLDITCTEASDGTLRGDTRFHIAESYTKPEAHVHRVVLARGLKIADRWKIYQVHHGDIHITGRLV